MPEFFRVRTFHQTCLYRLPDGEVCHLDPANAAGLSEVLVWTPLPGCVGAVLLADCKSDATVTIFPDQWRSATFPLRLVLLKDGSYSIAHPYSGHLVLALPSGGPGARPLCVFSGNLTAQGWETYTLEPVQPSFPETTKRGDQASQLFSLAGEGMRALLLSRPSGNLAEAVARLVPPNDFELTARQFVDDPVLAAAALSVAGDSPYAVALSNLLLTGPARIRAQRSRWRPWQRRALTGGQADRVNDARFVDLGPANLNERYNSFPQRLSAAVRRQRMPTKRLCVLASARNEGPYILEWIAYHRLLGVEHFYICSNDNDDGSDALLMALDAAGIITWIENTGTPRHHQVKAYGHALSIIPDLLEYEWVGVLDLDEFITLRPGGLGTITDFLDWQEHQPVDVVALTWCIHWSGSNVRWSDDLTLARFKQQNEGASLVKSIFRPRKFTAAHPHHPLVFDNTAAIVARDALGDQLTYPRGVMTGPELPEARFGEAWVNHYFCRSAEEFLWKWARNKDVRAISSFADVPEHFLEGFMANHMSTGMHAPDGVSAWLPAVTTAITDLRRLPGVEKAISSVLENTRSRALETTELVNQLKACKLSEPKRRFLELFPS